MSFFKQLSEEEEEEFRKWAMDNFVPGEKVNPVWHPIVREEWERLQNTHDRITTDETWLDELEKEMSDKMKIDKALRFAEFAKDDVNAIPEQSHDMQCEQAIIDASKCISDAIALLRYAREKVK